MHIRISETPRRLRFFRTLWAHQYRALCESLISNFGLQGHGKQTSVWGLSAPRGARIHGESNARYRRGCLAYTAP
jgi:hypothetical protein